MASAKEQRLVFDDFVVDFAARRLSRAGQALALEPKAFAVLALLAASPGTAFTRDQILDTVWGHRHVTPGVLSRVMVMLRQALGEEANAPRYLHTLHGVGYRFDLPDLPDLPLAVAAIAPPSDEEIELAPSEPATPAEAVQRPAPRTSLRTWAVLGATTLLIALAAAWLPRGARSPEQGVVAPASPPTLIVMPLKPIGEQGSTRDIAAGLSEELISELAHIAGLQVIAHESTALVAAESARMADLVPRLGITHALEGSLRQSGEAMRVNIRLTEMVSSRTLWSQDFDREAADALALQREIAQAVATALALKLALVPAQRSGDAEFLRRYFAAQSRVGVLRANSVGVEQAEAEFRELVYLRPDDARTHAGLASALESRAFQHPELADALRQEAAREADIALRLDPRQADARNVHAAAACRAEDWERCVALAESAIESAPSNSQMRFRHALVLASLGYLDRGEAMLRAGKARDPLNGVWSFALGRLLDTQGQHDAARAELDRSGPRVSPYGSWFNAVWRGDLDTAEAIARRLGENREGDRAHEALLRPSYLATTQALRDPGLWPQAFAAMDAWEAQTGLMNFTRVLAPDADPEKMLTGLATARRRSYSTWDLLVWTKDLAYLRRGPAFQRYLVDTGILAYWQRHGFPPQCKPQPEGAACD